MTHTFLLVFTLLSIWVQIESLCNVCQENYAACLDEKRFSLCTAGKPEDKIYTCPDGYVCTKTTSVCLKQSETRPVTASCEMACGLCNSPGKLFSCSSNTTYAFCFGKDVPDLSATGLCPDGYVCNLKSREICKKTTDNFPSCNAVLEEEDSTRITTSGTIESTVTTVTDGYSTTTVTIDDEITTGWEEVTTIEVTSPKTTTALVDISVTSPSSPTLATTEGSEYESSFCNLKQAEGPYRSENDSTCQKFVLCYILAGQYLELQYTCSGSNFFNEKTKNCQTEKPVDCL